MFMVHAVATLNQFSNTQIPISSGFSHSQVFKVKFADPDTLKSAFTSSSGFKALRQTTQFQACIMLLGARADEVVTTIASWLLPLINRDFEGIPLVIGLPDKVAGSTLFELRNNYPNVAFVDNRANPDLFQKCQKLVAYAGAMIRNVVPQDGEVVMEHGSTGGPTARGRGRGRGGRGGGARGGRRGRGRRFGAYPY